jgi:hypothetical protein
LRNDSEKLHKEKRSEHNPNEKGRDAIHNSKKGAVSKTKHHLQPGEKHIDHTITRRQHVLFQLYEEADMTIRRQSKGDNMQQMTQFETTTGYIKNTQK